MDLKRVDIHEYSERGVAEIRTVEDQVKHKVLIIDDEADIRFLLKLSLRSAFVVEASENLSEGLSAFTAVMPDVLILDINLPDGNGAEQAHIFRDLKPECIIILISADSDHMMSEYKKHKADFFLKKPFAPSELTRIISEQLRLRITPTEN